MIGLLTEEYIMDYVRTLIGTPYESTIDVFLDGLSSTFSPQPVTPSPQPVTFSPSSSIPSMIQTTRPTYESHIDVFFDVNFYIAYNAPSATRQPSPEEYQALLAATGEYSTAYLQMLYQDTGVEFEVSFSIADTRYNAGIPWEQFNIYVAFLADCWFWDKDEGKLPSSEYLLGVLAQSFSADYIPEYVRTLVGTPFESTNELVFGPAPSST